MTYSGIVSGNGAQPYTVHIDKQYLRKSTCNCSFADSRRVVCKQMVALLFTAEPKVAEDFLKEVEEYEAGKEAREQQHYEDMKKYVKSLSKSELQDRLLDALVQLEERRNYITILWRETWTMILDFMNIPISEQCYCVPISV